MENAANFGRFDSAADWLLSVRWPHPSDVPCIRAQSVHAAFTARSASASIPTQHLLSYIRTTGIELPRWFVRTTGAGTPASITVCKSI